MLQVQRILTDGYCTFEVLIVAHSWAETPKLRSNISTNCKLEKMLSLCRWPVFLNRWDASRWWDWAVSCVERKVSKVVFNSFIQVPVTQKLSYSLS
jgi:hypothetical protein